MKHRALIQILALLLLLLTGCLVTWENHIRVFSLPTLEMCVKTMQTY